jgi:uncharacterized surface protein with fasciclin (FAS1) repeats
MKTFSKLMGCTALAVTLTTGSAYAGQSAGMTKTGDIVDTAVAAGSFNTLVTAVKAADLVGTLKGSGPFTVFAPTDEAFAKLPAGTIENLLKPENKAQLVKILTYHVVPGRITSDDISGQKVSVETVQGQTVNVDATYGVKVNEANVVQADISASNGVIHVIDTVILPRDENASADSHIIDGYNPSSENPRSAYYEYMASYGR